MDNPFGKQEMRKPKLNEYFVKSNAKTHINNDCWSLDYIYRLHFGWTCLTYGNLCCPKWRRRQLWLMMTKLLFLGNGAVHYSASNLDLNITINCKNTSLLTLRYYLKCIHNSIYAQLKAWANSFIENRATTRICAKKPFIVIECNCDCFGFSKFPIKGRKLWSQVKKTLTSSYLRTGMRK